MNRLKGLFFTVVALLFFTTCIIPTTTSAATAKKKVTNKHHHPHASMRLAKKANVKYTRAIRTEIQKAPKQYTKYSQKLAKNLGLKKDPPAPTVMAKNAATSMVRLNGIDYFCTDSPSDIAAFQNGKKVPLNAKQRSNAAVLCEAEFF